jgi:putative nucleotidyltransferase with HDIG domain
MDDVASEGGDRRLEPLALPATRPALFFGRERQSAPFPTEVQALVEDGRRAEHLGHHGTARRRFEEALHALLRLRAPAGVHHVIRWIGDVHREQGDSEAAADCYEASRAVAEAQGAAGGVAYALCALGSVQQLWGKLEAAESLYEEARELAERVGDARLLGMIEHNLSLVARTRGDLNLALYLARIALGRFQDVNDPAATAQVLANTGVVRGYLEQWDEAEAMLDRAADLCDAASDRRGRMRIEVSRSELHLRRGDLFRARESCDAAFEIGSRLGERLALGEIFKNYGVIFREMGKYSLAETHLQQAAEAAEVYTNPLLAAEAQRELAELFQLQNRNREALHALNYAHRIFDDLRARRNVADVNRRIRQLEEVYLAVMRRWGESIESQDHYTAGHCDRVADLSSMLARALGFDEHTITWLRMGAFLHDVGKVEVPPEILNKEDRLTPEEWEIMRRHPLAGVELLRDVDFPWDVRPLVRSHHEHWDGGGYPDGLRGKAIPLSARILCIADVYDALTTRRAYRESHTPHEALSIMRADAGRIFDPELYDLFERIVMERQERAQPAG